MSNLKELEDKLKTFGMNNTYVLGMYFTGSYTKKFHHHNSDLDIVFIVDNGVKDKFEIDLLDAFCLKDHDVQIWDFKEFGNLSTAGTSGMGSFRYDFCYVDLIVDKMKGELQSIIEAHSILDEEETKYLGSGYLDGYINDFHRSLKAHSQGWKLPTKIEAVLSIDKMLNFIFASNSRITPYSKYLEWDMVEHNLDIPLSVDELLKLIDTILTTADIKAQIALFYNIREHAYKTGFGHVVEGWEGKPEKYADALLAKTS